MWDLGTTGHAQKRSGRVPELRASHRRWDPDHPDTNRSGLLFNPEEVKRAVNGRNLYGIGTIFLRL